MRGLPSGSNAPTMQAAPVVAHVDGAVEVADDRQVAAGAFHRLRLRPVVLRRVQREPGAGEQAEVARPEPGGDDRDLALHRRRGRSRRAVTRPRSTRKPVTRAPSTTRTPRSAAALAVAKVGPAGVDRRVLLEEDAAGQVVDGEQRRDGGDLVARHFARRQAVMMGQGQRVAQLGEALRRAGEGERAVGVVAGVDAGERREPRGRSRGCSRRARSARGCRGCAS